MKVTPEQAAAWFETVMTASGTMAAGDIEALCRTVSDSPVRQRRVRARELLRVALDMSMTWDAKTWRDSNSAVIAKGLIPILEMHDIVDERDERQGSKIVRSARITNVEDYYLAKELLDCVDSGLSVRQQDRLGRAILAYEQRPRKNA